MNTTFKNRRGSLLWRTIFLLSIVVIISQVVIYFWIQRSVNEHFEQMDAEILTHAAFNLRQRLSNTTNLTDTLRQSITTPSSYTAHQHTWQNYEVESYDIKILMFDENGQRLTNTPRDFVEALPLDFDILTLWQRHHEQQFSFQMNDRNYRLLIIRHQKTFALIALPIDVHHQYLIRFNRRLSLILLAITLLLVSVAALSVYWGFAPLATIVQKMKSIHPERLDERITVSDMPLELRALAASYNDMMVTLERNFDSLLRFSDNIAHELRTPIATLSTQTQVMLSQPRENEEYIEQLHHQLDTLGQLSAMINNMLLLAKTQKGLSDTQIKTVDTANLMRKLIDYFEMMSEDRGITFVTSGDFLPVSGDAGLLQRLFANLMSNAIYYAASDSVISITATSSAAKKNAKDNAKKSIQPTTLSITMTNQLDNPLPSDNAKHLFERFYRHDTTRQHSGSGLGLSIVQAIAHAHKGCVSIDLDDQYYFKVKVTLLLANQ